MSLINVNNLTFSYAGSYDNIFENVSFQIDTDWKLGFIGRNGRGKTTFLSLLMNKYEFQGKISSDTQYLYFPFVVQNDNKQTLDVIEEIIEDFELWKLEKELSLLDVDLDILFRPFMTLSKGEQTKTLLAALFLKDNYFLLIDEPTNHLDTKGREIVASYLNSKKGFILVSHDRRFLDNCIDHVLSINKTNIEIQKGNFSSWWNNKQSQDNYELVQNIKYQKDIKRLEEASKRTAGWADKIEKSKNEPLSSGLKPEKGYIGHKAAKMMKRAKSIEDRQLQAIDEKSQLLKNIESSEQLKIHPLDYYNNCLVEFNNCSINYDGKVVCDNIRFTINNKDRIALIGKNGSGKSSILKLIKDKEISYFGQLYIGSNLKVSYVSQDTSFLSGNLKDYARENNIDESLFKSILRKLDFSREQFEKDIQHYSGGQKKKVLIAKSLCEEAHLYIWDEPLNFIDVFSRMQIEELILNNQATMIFVEHDELFVDKIATKKIFI